MKKITLFLSLLLFPFVLSAQQCPDPVADSDQYFCSGATNVLDDFVVTATGTLTWYADRNGTTVLPGTTSIVDGVVYYVSQTNTPTCTESNLIPVVGFYSEMPRPDAKSDQYFCSSSNPTLDDFIVTATGTLTWYDSAAGTTVLPGATPLVNGTTYYVSQQGPLACSESDLTPITAYLQAVTPKPIADLHQYFCTGATPVLDDFIVVSAGTLTWYAGAMGGAALPGNTPMVDGTTYYVSSVETGCSASARVPVTGHFSSMPDPIADSDQYFCMASGPTLKDFYVEAIGTLTWYDDAAGTNVLHNATPIVDGDTYYVSQQGPLACSESGLIAITGHFQPNTPDPRVESVQYFCTGSSQTLNDLTVTATGTLTWYDDAAGTNTLPGTTPIVSGTTYYVSSTDPGCTESGLVPITVYLQSIHFEVSPASCIDLGNNMFLVKSTDTVTIKVLNIHGDLINGAFAPPGRPLNLDPLLTQQHFALPAGFNTLYFGNGTHGLTYEYTVTTQNELGVCSGDSQNLTILNGAYRYDDLCFNDATTLNDIGIPNNDLVWFSDEDGLDPIPGTTIIKGNTTYYFGVGDPSCPDIFPAIIGYKVPPPSGSGDYSFCTATTWSQAGLIPPANQIKDLIICGVDLNWYGSLDPVNPIPDTTPLVNGATYYVTQTINGCESAPLPVKVTERTCACITNPGFETQDGEADPSGITIFHNPISGNYPNFQVCNMTFLYNNPISLGPPESPTSCSQYSTYASIVTAGWDPTLKCMGVDFPRTSPLGNTCSKFSMRLNRNIPNTSQNSGAVTMRKEMIAGEVLAFDFAILMENPTHHIPFGDEPFFSIKVFDKNGGLVEERCIKANNGDCILNERPNLPGSSYTLLYSDWSCVKMNTNRVQGERIRVEFTAITCQPDFHMSYVYIDNIYTGDDGPNVCSNSSFGYLAMDSIVATTAQNYDNTAPLSYDENCSLLTIGASNMGDCDAALPFLNPEFPFTVRVHSTSPQSAIGKNPPQQGSVDVKIYKNNNQVGSTNTVITNTQTTFDYEVDYPRDFVPGTAMYGFFSIEASTKYMMNCGFPYDYPLESSIDAFKICPVAACVPPLAECSPDPTVTTVTFDLTQRSAAISANYDPALNETVVNYYPTAADAMAGTNRILNPNMHTRPTPGNYTVYARLDFNWAILNAGPAPNNDLRCFDVVPLNLIAGAGADIPDHLVMGPLTQCPDSTITDYEFDLTTVESDLTQNLVPITDYSWDYYESQNDALASTSPISNPANYVSTIGPGGTQVIWVRVDSPDCYALTSFELIVHPEIVFTVPTDYELCDDQVADGFTQFDLNTKITEMTNNDPNLDVTFHTDPASAETGTSPIALLYTNTSNPQTIHVRIEDDNGCYELTQFELIVNPNPEPGLVSNMIECDLNGTGTAQFDLTIPGAEILNGQTDMTVRFYLTQGAADAGIGPGLGNLYTNTSSQETIFFRLENNVTGCFTTGSFIIEVVDSPPITDPITDYYLCDNDQDGSEEFDLTSKEVEILNTIPPATITITYYNILADANAGIPGTEIGTPAAYPSAGNETIYFRAEFNTAVGCYSVGEFQLMLHPPVAFNTPDPLVVCDTGSSTGMAPFDLTVATTQMTGNDPNLNVTYYETEPQAELGDPNDQLPSTYTNTTPYNQTIWVRIVNLTTDCYVVVPLDLEVKDAPLANQGVVLTYCDEDNDGIGSFTLSDANTEITGGIAGVTVSYHVTFANADNNVLPLPLLTPFYNTVPYSQIIYARVESPGVDCYSIVEVELKVLDSPQTEAPDDLVACDLNNNGTGVFDLTEVEPQLMVNITNPADFTIEYFATAIDLANDISIGFPKSYTSISNQQTIYVVVEDISNGCQSMEEFEIRTVALPEIFHPDPLELCDVNNPNDGVEQFNLNLATAQITGGNTSIGITYHETQEDACDGTDALPALYTNTINNQTIYIRAESEDGCVVCTGYTLTLIVNPLPSPTLPDPLEVCDPSNDGFSEFNLEDATAQIKNNEPNSVVTYHSTWSDADLGIFPLADPYANIVPYNQTVYVRVEFSTTGCYTIIELELIVHDVPIVPVTLPDIVVCSEDQTETGVLFDLTVNESVIYGTQNPSDFDLTYHETEQNAIDGILRIEDPENYFNISNPQYIWVRLGDPDTGCGTVRRMTLIVDKAPEIDGPFQLELCGDGMTTEFDLTVMDDAFTMGALGMDVKYYLTDDYIDHIDPAYAYTNTSNPQTIYVKVTDGFTGCSSYSTLTLIVNPNPDIETPDPIEFCDVNGDGFWEFDLTVREADIRNGEVGTISYHLTLEDAENNVDPIADPEHFTNTETPEQIIYVRLTNDVTGCYSIVELLLIVNPLPEVGDPVSDYIICEIQTDNKAIFDLTTKIPEILGSQDPLDFEVKFYENQFDSENRINEIDTPDNFTNRTNPQEIFYNIDNRSTDCFIVAGSFFIEVREGAEAFPPTEMLLVCENELGTGMGTFDLTQFNDEILGGQDPTIFIVTFYESLLDAENDENAIPDPTNYTGSNGIIYVRVTNSDTGCYAIVEMELDVIELPFFEIGDTYRLCVDAEGNPIMEASGETSPPVIDTGLNGLQYEFIWMLNGEVLVDETSPSLAVAQGGVYSVTVIDMVSGCEFTASTQVTVSSPPLVYNAQVTSLPFSYPHTIEATASGLGEYMFQLDNGPAQSSGVFTNVESGSHTITIFDINGCGSVTIEVGAIDYPLFFTPNGDGYHDTWNIYGIDAIPSAKIYIFDRHGKLLKQLSPTGPDWDGTYNGNPMPSSDYWFRVVYSVDGVEKEYKGHFTLKR